MSCLLWAKHDTLGFSAFIFSLNHGDGPVRCNGPYVTSGKLKLKVVNWLARVSTAPSGLAGVQVQVLWTPSPVSFFSTSQLFQEYHASEQLNPTFYHRERFSNLPLCQQIWTSEGFLFLATLDAMLTAPDSVSGNNPDVHTVNVRNAHWHSL